MSEARPAAPWPAGPRRLRALSLGLLVALLALIAAAAVVWRGDIIQAGWNPNIPFQIYEPPAAPDYRQRSAWLLYPGAEDKPADVFFVHPTSFNGGEHWNGPIDDAPSQRFLSEVVLPNYAGPFERSGRIFAPKYRQASLFAMLRIRDDAREARQFAYGDVRAAFQAFLAQSPPGRPIILVGVEQGGELAARLLNEEIGPRPDLRARLAAAYLIDTFVPARDYAPGAPAPACASPEQTGCVLAWATQVQGEDRQEVLDHGLVWRGERLVNRAGDESLCVNPILGRATGDIAPESSSRGASNATGMDWDARPALVAHRIQAQCRDGRLLVTAPQSPTLRRSGGWVDRQKVRPFNYFYADLEEDATRRLQSLGL